MVEKLTIKLVQWIVKRGDVDEEINAYGDAV